MRLIQTKTRQKNHLNDRGISGFNIDFFSRIGLEIQVDYKGNIQWQEFAVGKRQNQLLIFMRSKTSYD